MEPLEPDDYSRYSTKPVPCDPWDPQTKVVAHKLLLALEELFVGLDVALLHMGSTALEIPGKNEVEVYILPASGLWERVIDILTKVYGEPGYQSTEFFLYNTQLDGYDIELIQMRGYASKVNKALFQYLARNPAVCEEYVAIKRQYSHSKREYQRHKEQFFARIVRQIPDDDVPS